LGEFNSRDLQARGKRHPSSVPTTSSGGKPQLLNENFPSSHSMNRYRIIELVACSGLIDT
jgi:hypothetical protein